MDPIWDGGLSDLAAAGVEVTASEEARLYLGGPLMYLRPLGSPMRHCYGYTTARAHYESGSEVFVPMRITSVAPDARYQPTWTSDAMTVWDYMDHQYMPVWRKWPSYIGVADLDSLMTLDNPEFPEWERAEDLAPFRVWNCVPIASDEDLAAVVRLEEAAQRMLNDSHYWELEFVLITESQGDIDYEEVCVAYGLAADPTWTKEERKSQRQRSKEWARTMVDSKGDAHITGQRWIDLVDAGLVHWTWEMNDNGRKLIGEPRYRELTTYLDSGDEHARNLWWRAMSRRAYARERMAATFYPDREAKADFNSQELYIA